MRMRSSLGARVLPVFVLLAFSFAFISCDSGGGSGGGNVSTEDAQEDIENTDSGISATSDNLQNGEFGTKAKSLFEDVSLSDFGSFATSSKTGHNPPLGVELINKLDQVLDVQEGLNFSGSTGTYAWNGSDSWNKTGSSSSKIVLNFPTSRMEEGTNDATFTLSKYSDTEIRVDGRDELIPKTITANLKVDDGSGGTTEIFSVDLSGTSFYNATVGLQGEKSQVPQKFLLKALTEPVFHTFDFSSSSKQDFTFDVTLEKGQEGGDLAFGVLVDADLTNDFDKISPGDSVFDKLSGTLDLSPKVAIDYEVDVDDLNGLDNDASVQKLNNEIQATILSNGNTAGTIKYATEIDIVLGEELDQPQQLEEPQLVVQYSGGEKESLFSAFPNASSLVLLGAGSVSTFSKKASTVGGDIVTVISSVF